MHFGASGRDQRPCDAVVLVSWVLFTCKRHLSHPFSSLNPTPSGSATSQEKFSRVLRPTINVCGAKDFLVILIHCHPHKARFADSVIINPLLRLAEAFVRLQYRRRHIDLNWSRPRKRDHIKRSAIAGPERRTLTITDWT